MSRASPRRRRATSCYWAGWVTSARSIWSVSKGPGPMAPGSPATSGPRGIRVVEVDRPNRQRRRRKGKSMPEEDAISAARAALSGDACR